MFAIYLRLWLVQFEKIRYMHPSKGFAMPSPTSMWYESVLRIAKFCDSHPKLESLDVTVLSLCLVSE